MWKSLVDILPRGGTLAEADWQRRHRLLQWVLLAHVPALAVLGVALGSPPVPLLVALVIPVVCAVVGRLTRGRRRIASAAVTAGLVWCSTALVGITGGSIEAHFHFFIIIGFIALYQDWVPFLLNVLFTVVSHGVGSMWLRTLIFNHPAGQANPWLWSLVHGVAVLLACVGVMLFWRVTEDEQTQKDELTRKLADAEIGRRRFTSDMLVNLARRNQSMLYRQLEIINQLEESERNPDALAELFRLDHLTTRVRRNAENLLVLSGEKPPRVWSQPVPLRDVVRAAIAETEDIDRVVFEVPEGPLVDGASVTDLTHLLAELTENAVRFSPPDLAVTIRGRRDPRGGPGHLLTVEDWGVGMEDDDLAAANALLADPPEVDLSVSKRLGFHVVARLAARHGIGVRLSPTPGSGVTASISLPGSLFEAAPEPVGAVAVGSADPTGGPAGRRVRAVRPIDGGPGPHLPTPGPVPLRPASRPALVPDARTEQVAQVAQLPQADRAVPDRRTAPGPRRDAHPVEQPGAAGRPPASWTGWWVDPEGPSGGSGPNRPDNRPDVRTDVLPDGRGDVPADAAPAARLDLPAPRSVPVADQPGAEARRGAPTPVAAAVPSAPAPAGTPPATPAAGGETKVPTLRRRVPQAHLAPGLRVVASRPEAADPAPLPVAAEALSRYQASRAAARSAVDRDAADGSAGQ